MPRSVLESDAGCVVVTAAAGCGKTHEAAQLAHRWAAELEPGQQVLVLAHTNAAVDEFRRRTHHVAARVRADTFDAFALDLVSPYARPLGFPTPLQRHVGEREGPGFHELAPAAVHLLERAPTLARLLGRRYPRVILDEHQDSTPAQHALACAVASSGRLRIFGDPMQAIYPAPDDGGLIDWSKVKTEADALTALDTPQRWRHAPRFGAWLGRARTALEAGQPLPLGDAPPEVAIDWRPDLECLGFGRGDPRPLSPIVHRFADQLGDRSGAMLAYPGRLAQQLTAVSRGRLSLNEGADYDDVYRAARALSDELGDPQACARTLLDLLQRSGSGLNQDLRGRLERRLAAGGVDLRRAGSNHALLEALAWLWWLPDLQGVRCAAAGLLAGPLPRGVNIRKPQALAVLAATYAGPSVDIRDAVAAAVKVRKLGATKPWRCASTIHKAKGLEFDDVLLLNASANHFPDTNHKRKLLYVALSRASRRVSIVVPGRAPSPLFRQSA